MTKPFIAHDGTKIDSFVLGCNTVAMVNYGSAENTNSPYIQIMNSGNNMVYLDKEALIVLRRAIDSVLLSTQPPI